MLGAITTAVCGGVVKRGICGNEAGGADDVDFPLLGCQLDMLDRSGRAGEFEHRIGLGEEIGGIVGDGDAEGVDAGDEAEIAADGGRARLFVAADDQAAIVGRDRTHEHLAHAAGAAMMPTLARSPWRPVAGFRSSRVASSLPPPAGGRSGI
jgi:hypothetical protein